MSHVVFILPSVLWHNQQTIAHLVLRPKPRNRRGDFVGQITKPQLPVLKPNPGNPSEWFWGQTARIVATGFEVKQGETIDLGFDAEPRNVRASSTCGWCRPHIASPDLSIVRPQSTWLVLDHPRSSAPSLLLLPRFSSLPAMPHLSPTHHETIKHVFPHETYNRVEPTKFLRFKIKPRHVHYSSQIKPRHVHYSSQIKPRTTWFLNLSLDEYIDNRKAQSLNFESKTTWSITRRQRPKEKLKKII
jgi:hypothetical protein